MMPGSWDLLDLEAVVFYHSTIEARFGARIGLTHNSMCLAVNEFSFEGIRRD